MEFAIEIGLIAAWIVGLITLFWCFIAWLYCRNQWTLSLDWDQRILATVFTTGILFFIGLAVGNSTVEQWDSPPQMVVRVCEIPIQTVSVNGRGELDVVVWFEKHNRLRIRPVSEILSTNRTPESKVFRVEEKFRSFGPWPIFATIRVEEKIPHGWEDRTTMLPNRAPAD